MNHTGARTRSTGVDVNDLHRAGAEAPDDSKPFDADIITESFGA